MFLVAFPAVYRLAFNGLEGNLRLFAAVRAGGIVHFSLPEATSLICHSFHLAKFSGLDSKPSEAKNENRNRTFLDFAYFPDLTTEVVNARLRI